MSKKFVAVGGDAFSNVFAVIGGIVCIYAGFHLAVLEARQENSMIQSIANGMGVYFIGKGVYMISMVQQLRGLFRGLMTKSED